MISSPPTLRDLFSQYVRLRQGGQAMEQVVTDLQNDAYQLPRDERKRLGTLVMEWEAQHGREPAPTRPTVPALPNPPVVQVPTPPAPERPPAPFGTRFLDPAKLGQVIQPLEPLIRCPKCGKATGRNMPVCPACGHSLPNGSSITRRLDETSGGKKPAMDPVYFGPTGTLILSIRGVKANVLAYPRDQLTLGWKSPLASLQVNVDLAPYNAEALGVSRVHAEIRVHKQMLVLSDLDSDNGTYVNEQRLYPIEARVLRNGDDVRFGRLTLKLTFKNETRT